MEGPSKSIARTTRIEESRMSTKENLTPLGPPVADLRLFRFPSK